MADSPLLRAPHSPAEPANFLVRLLREPLLHFVVLGAILFAADRALHRPNEIHVSAALRAELEQELSSRLGRAPSQAENERALARGKLEEALYREGLERGLDRDDSLVRARVIKKFQSLQAALFVPRTPPESELKRWFEAHRDLYEVPARYDFEEVLADGVARADQLQTRAWVAELNAGSAPGPSTATLEKHQGWARSEVEQAFGAEFALALAELTPGRWQVVQSKQGYRAVRVSLIEGGLPPNDELRARLIHDVQRAEQEKLLRQAEVEVLQSYRFVEDPP